MNKTLTVLSIDFDFFQIVDEDTIRTCYPDGHDNTTELSMFVWSSYYVDKYLKEKITNVKPNETKLRQLMNILRKCNMFTPSLVANSHKHIYDFIHNQLKSTNSEKLELINIDMHHDMFDNGDELDCGNWVSLIKKDIPTEFTWIANEISEKIYGDSFDKNDKLQTDFNCLKNKKIDAIFICRSDTWLPPHLDKSFDKLLKFMCNNFYNVICEKCVTTPRNMTPLIKQLEMSYNTMLGEKHG